MDFDNVLMEKSYAKVKFGIKKGLPFAGVPEDVNKKIKVNQE